MAAFLITWQESDGNDCRVFDTVVLAETEDAALDILSTQIERDLHSQGTEFSEDGNQLGYYFDCTEDCTEDCEGHGGISLRTVEPYETESIARSAMSRWHAEYAINYDGGR